MTGSVGGRRLQSLPEMRCRAFPASQPATPLLKPVSFVSPLDPTCPFYLRALSPLWSILTTLCWVLPQSTAPVLPKALLNLGIR